MAPDRWRCRTYQYRLHPTTRQTRALLLQLDYQRELYNAALEERVGAWKWERRSVSFFDQCRTLTGLAEIRPEVVASGVVLCRGTLKRLDRAFAAFYRRVKTGETPGYPRFKSASRFHSLQWEDTNGWKVKSEARRLYLLGIGEIKANYHRPLLGTPKAITVKREGATWWVGVRCVDVPATPLASTGREVGLDLGVINLVATSEGELIVGEHFGSQARAQLTFAQQRLATKQRGSNRRRRQVDVVARLHRKVANQRRNAAHQLSRRLVNDYDLIVLEDLAITNMVCAPKAKPDPEVPGAFLLNGAKAKTGLNRSIHDAGWGTLASLLSYKAESAGRIVVTVDPRHTSQMCAKCGHVEAGNRVNQAEFCCLACGHRVHADVNAARNILRAGRARQALACVGRI
ncbi:MAG TPA: transposase [Acidimicrobiales bacterium]|nr:transposase [Acidimicrobiales bacterium]